jgi:DNA polymerase-3 subunit delta
MAGFTFICGDDDYLVQDRGRQCFNRMIEETGADEFGQEIIEGGAGNFSEVETAVKAFIHSVQTLPMFGSEKVVWFKDISFLGDSVTGRAKGTQEFLEGHLKPILARLDGAGVRVLLTAFPVDRRRSLFKWLQKTADYEYIGGDKDGSALFALIQKVCDETGVTMTQDASNLLIERVSHNARLVKLETEKLATYVGDPGASIDEALVNAFVPNFGEADFFEAAEVFYTLELEATLAALRRHFFTRPDARGLISNLQRMNRLLIQLRVLSDSGDLGRSVNKSTLEAAGIRYQGLFGEATGKSAFHLFTQNPFYLSRLLNTAKRIHLRRLIDFQVEFLRAFEAIIDRPQDQEAVMRETAIRCLG